MVSKRAYSRVKVKSVDVNHLTAKAKGVAKVSVGLDIGKLEIVACLRWPQGQFERPWSVNNPFEINALVELCVEMSKVVEVVVAMESTGTYGDAVRRALTVAKIPVMRVAGKHVSDYTEIFDGVPSQHDGKDAAMIAELSAMGKGANWNYIPDTEALAHVRYHVRSIDHAKNEFVRLIGKLEASVARHWPELTREIELSSPTALKLLGTYGSPTEAAKNSELKTQLRKWGPKFTPGKIDRIVDATCSSSGIPMDSYEMLWMKDLATQAVEANRKILRFAKGIEEILLKDTFWCNYVKAVGAGTLGVLLTTVGDPRNYPNAGSLLKALGLNLKERSSGARIGEKAITKRGSAQARRWLYFWSLRAVQQPALKEWYFRFHATQPGQLSKGHRKMKGLICLMRKLVRSLRRSVCDGVAFDYQKVTDQPKPASRRRRRTKKEPVANFQTEKTAE
jgi:transposase